MRRGGGGAMLGSAAVLPRRTAMQSGPPRVASRAESGLRQKFFDKWTAAIAKETEASHEEFRRRTSARSDGSLVYDGLMIRNTRAEPRGNLWGENVVCFFPSVGGRLPYHQLKEGDSALVSRTSPHRDLALEGIIFARTASYVSVSTKQSLPSDLTVGTWRLDKGEDRVTYTACLEAVYALTKIRPAGMQQTDVPKVAAAADALSSGLMPFFFGFGPETTARVSLGELAAKPPPPRLAALYSGKQPPADFAQWRLNDSQRQAILKIPGRQLSLIKGPPGCGKTTTAVCLLDYLVHMLRGNRITILATAFTNVGTDNLVEGLLKRGIKALRIGSPVRVRSELHKATLDAKIQEHPTTKQMASFRENRIPPEVIRRMEIEMLKEIVYGADVICATCISSGLSILANLDFPVVLIDECTQATEPATLCPVVKGCQQLILLGDDAQLGPTVITSDPIASSQLSTSFFQRMVVADGGVEPFLLDTQYRMHPAISEWPSIEFYGSMIKDGITSGERPPPSGFAWPVDDFPVAFVECTGKEEKTADESKLNTAEAAIVCRVVGDLVKAGMPPGDIGVITPYTSQVRELTDALRRTCNIDLGNSAAATMGASAAGGAEPDGDVGLTVHTVDGYQGREKQVIVFSAVRSNDKGEVGFLSDWRRMNVAITRARCGLIVVGNPSTLSRDEHWGKWCAWAESKGIVVRGGSATAASAAQKRSRGNDHGHSHGHFHGHTHKAPQSKQPRR